MFGYVKEKQIGIAVGGAGGKELGGGAIGAMISMKGGWHIRYKGPGTPGPVNSKRSKRPVKQKGRDLGRGQREEGHIRPHHGFGKVIRFWHEMKATEEIE